MMAKSKTTPRALAPTQETTAAKRPDKTKKFLADISAALDIFDDEISSLGDCHSTAYETFILSYRSAFANIWPKIKVADVKIVLQSVEDKELDELRRMSQIMSSDSSKPALIKENHAVPKLDNILGSMVNRIPDQKLPNKEMCSLISTIFSDLVEAHKHYSSAAHGIADIATLITPEQLTLVLAAAVPPTLQLVMPPGVVSPLSTPPPPPKPATTVVGRLEMVKYCKTKILPKSTDEVFQKCEERTPVQVLAAAIFCTLEKHLFDETMPRADIANSFGITATQLHKAITGVDYQSGPHVYKRKRKTTDTASTDAKIQRTESAPSAAPSTSTQGQEKQKIDELSGESETAPTAEAIPLADTLSSESSDSLPDVPFK